MSTAAQRTGVMHGQRARPRTLNERQLPPRNENSPDSVGGRFTAVRCKPRALSNDFPRKAKHGAQEAADKGSGAKYGVEQRDGARRRQHDGTIEKRTRTRHENGATLHASTDEKGEQHEGGEVAWRTAHTCRARHERRHIEPLARGAQLHQPVKRHGHKAHAARIHAAACVRNSEQDRATNRLSARRGEKRAKQRPATGTHSNNRLPQQ